MALSATIALAQDVPAAAAHANAAPVNATIDTTRLHQEIYGFGASVAYYQNYLARHPHSAQIYDALFSPENGLRIDYLRLNARYRYEDQPASGQTGHFDPAHIDPDTAEIVKRANSLRSAPLSLMLASWSPPASLKSNGSEKNGGTLIKKDGQYAYADFAKYWKDSVLAYRAAGVNADYVSIQNEPDQTVPYESCRFNPTEEPFHGESYAGYDKALDAVYKALQQIPRPPRMLAPDVIGIGYGKLQAYTKAANPAEVYAIAHHYYTGGDKKRPDSFLASMQATHNDYADKLLFQTEFYTPDGYESALMIENSLAVEQVNIYLYWPLVWPTMTGTLLEVEDPADPSKWKTPQGWSYTEGYYALKHFSYFLHAGYRRVEASTDAGEVRLSAYLSPKRDTLVVIAINTSPSVGHAVKLTLGPGPFAKGKSHVYRTTFPVTDEHFSSLSPLGADHMLTLPPHAIATVEIHR